MNLSWELMKWVSISQSHDMDSTVLRNLWASRHPGALGCYCCCCDRIVVIFVVDLELKVDMILRLIYCFN